MTISYRAVALASVLSNSKEIEVSTQIQIIYLYFSCLLLLFVLLQRQISSSHPHTMMYPSSIKASGGTLFPYGRVGGDGIGIGSIVSSPVKDTMASVFAFGIDSGGGSCHVDGGPFDTKV